MKVQICVVAFLVLFAMVQARRPQRECPEVDGDVAVSVRNPYDCSTFYKCDQGTYVLTACPAGLEYNRRLGVCDWPENANCVARPPRAEPY